VIFDLDGGDDGWLRVVTAC